MSEIKAVYRSRTRTQERTSIEGVTTAVDYLRSIWNNDTIELIEEFVMVCLNTAHQAIGWVKVSSGGFDSARVDPRIVFSLALQVGAAALVLAHNHPSGQVEPSAADRRLTERLAEAGKLLSIQVLDHIILGRETWFSFAENGLL